MKNITENKPQGILSKVWNGAKRVVTETLDCVKQGAQALLGLGTAAVAAGAVAASTVASHATNSFPDPSEIYTGLATPFNSALTWFIGAVAVLAVIGWIRKAIRK